MLDSGTEPKPAEFDKRILLLPLAAIVLIGLVFFKQYAIRQDRKAGPVSQRQLRSAPLFEATDLNNRRVRLERYIGRHEIFLIFFDGEIPVDQEPFLQSLKQSFDRLESESIIVLAISTALPQEYRRAIERSDAIPFPLLSDPTFEIHRQWGLAKSTDNVVKPQQGVFLIDRAGQVDWGSYGPQPLENPESELKKRIGE